MKTPREILLERHRDAEPKLDAIRRETLSKLERTEAHSADEPGRAAGRAPASWSAPVLWRFGFRRIAHQPRTSVIMESAPDGSGAHSTTWRWLLSLRWHLPALGAAWLLIALLNIDRSSEPAPPVAAQSAPSPSQVLMAVRENRRQLSELIETPLPARAAAPRPRSEIQISTAMT